MRTLRALKVMLTVIALSLGVYSYFTQSNPAIVIYWFIVMLYWFVNTLL